MKKIYTLSGALILAGGFAMAQVTLTYENHALLADKANEMKLTNFVDPGTGGENQVWDFSELTVVNDFKGMLTATYTTENNVTFPETNVELNEFGNKFYFKLNEQSVEQYGLVSSSGNLVIKYDAPFVKMKYPFTYGDYFQGNYSGKYHFKENDAIDITGTYSVEADGYGQLLLPGNQVIDNTLRVKTVRKYQRGYENNPNEIEVVTYRWYGQSERFPLLVLTSITSTTNGKSHVSHQAAYKENIAVISGVEKDLLVENIKVYPNPFKDLFNIHYKVHTPGNVRIELYDNAGKMVQVLVNDVRDAGDYTYVFKNENASLAKGNYFLKYEINGHSAVKTVVQVK